MDIIRLSMEEERIVITKDRDFFDFFVLQQRPYKVLLVTTGNIRNRMLMDLFRSNFVQIKDLLAGHSLVEFDSDAIVVHA